MNSGELKRAKRELRRAVLAERDALPPEERTRRSVVATERFLALPEADAAGTVLAFWSFGSELATGPLIDELHRRGTRVALPRIVDGELEARRYRPGDAVSETSFGAFEPTGGPPLDPTEIDLIVVPAVAFDRDGRRVGYGGGYYDRFLPSTRADAIRAGIGFHLQLVAAGRTVPAGHFDLRVDLVITETETVRCRSTS
jgi:5-formyltetrahydrofolate cyclo-ligase